MASKTKVPEKYVCTLSPELLKKAKEELNEDPERRERDIQELRERAERYPGLYVRTDGAFLVRYLRARKFNIDRAFEALLTFYRIKLESPEIFDNLQPSEISHVLDEEVISVLPERDEQGCSVVISRFGRWDPPNVSFIDSIREYLITLMKIVEDEETQVNGVVFVFDFKDTTFNQLYHMTPALLKKEFALFQDSFPMRIKGIHYVHEMSLIKYVFPLIKVFMKQKTLDRVHFHGVDYASLHKFIKPDILPEEYGGLKPTMSNKEWRNLLESCEEAFIEEQKYSLEKILAEYNSNKQDAMATLAGSFKQLES